MALPIKDLQFMDLFGGGQLFDTANYETLDEG